MSADDLGPPGGKEKPGATPDARPNQKSATTTDAAHSIAPYDRRHAARVTEDSGALAPIDHALTATGLAAQISECVHHLGRLS